MSLSPQAQQQALESGLVTMQDIEMLAADVAGDVRCLSEYLQPALWSVQL